MSARQFLAAIEDNKNNAVSNGMVLDLIVLPVSFAVTMYDAAKIEDLTPYEYRVSETGNIYLVGVKVLWSKDRLPTTHAWFRYTRKKEKK